MTEQMKQLLSMSYKGNEIEEYILILEEQIDILCGIVNRNTNIEKESMKFHSFEIAKECLKWQHKI